MASRSARGAREMEPRPKAPAPAFIMFARGEKQRMREQRRAAREGGGEAPGSVKSSRQVQRELAERWKGLPEHEKVTYKMAYKENYRKYAERMADWRAKLRQRVGQPAQSNPAAGPATGPGAFARGRRPRPASAYIRFCKAKHGDALASLRRMVDSGEMSRSSLGGAVVRRLAEMWRCASLQERKPFVDAYRADMETRPAAQSATYASTSGRKRKRKSATMERRGRFPADKQRFGNKRVDIVIRFSDEGVLQRQRLWERLTDNDGGAIKEARRIAGAELGVATDSEKDVIMLRGPIKPVRRSVDFLIKFLGRGTCRVGEPQICNDDDLSPNLSAIATSDGEPILPRRPANPFIRFCKAHRASVKASLQVGSDVSGAGSVDSKQVARVLGQKWSGLSSADREVYKAAYMADLEAYRAAIRRCERRQSRPDVI